MSIFVTGDKHGNFNLLTEKYFEIGKNLTKNDYVIVLGDFGVPFNVKPTEKEKSTLNWLNKQNWTTLFVDGNHENFDYLDKLESVPFGNSEVGKIKDSIFHLKRGNIYDLNGYKCLTFGGADSIDKNRRIPGVSWWPREIPSFKEYDNAINSLSENLWSVDFVFTHTGPTTIVKSIFKNELYLKDPVSDFLDIIMKKMFFKSCYFGHLHMEQRNIRNKEFLGDFNILFDEILQIV